MQVGGCVTVTVAVTAAATQSQLVQIGLSGIECHYSELPAQLKFKLQLQCMGSAAELRQA